MNQKQYRAVAVLTVIGSLLAHYKEDEQTKTFKILYKKIGNKIRHTIRNDMQFNLDLPKIDRIYVEAVALIPTSYIEPMLATSYLQSYTGKELKDCGLTDKVIGSLLAHYTNTRLASDIGNQLPKDTQEFAVNVFNKISELYGLPIYTRPTFRGIKK